MRKSAKAPAWPTTGRVDEVEWLDHCSENGWARPDRYDHTLSRCRSVGYVVKETKDTVTLLQNQASPNSVADTTTIAKKLIVRRRTLRKEAK